MRQALPTALGLVGLLFGFTACKDAAKEAPSANSAPSAAPPAASSADTKAPAPSAAPTAPSPPATPSAITNAGAAGGATLPVDASGMLTLAWKVEQRAYPKVAVSIVAGDATITLADLDATSDDSDDGKVSACAMRHSTATSSELWCGGVPAYNYYSAKLAGGALVITRHEGVDGQPSSERETLAARRPTSAMTFKMTGPASPLLSGNCRPGFVQRTAKSPCLRQCLKGNECPTTAKCQLVKVEGADGPHKVHACIPNE